MKYYEEKIARDNFDQIAYSHDFDHRFSSALIT